MFAFAGIKTGWDKRKEQRCLLVLCLLCWKTGWDKRKKPKNACLFVFVHFYRNQKWNKKLGLCCVHGGLHWFREDVRYYLDNQLIENCGNHWGENELYLGHSGPYGWSCMIALVVEFVSIYYQADFGKLIWFNLTLKTYADNSVIIILIMIMV